MSSRRQAWALRVSQAASYKALNRLMDDWHETVKADYRLQNSMDFESYMEARDWVHAGYVERCHTEQNLNEVTTMSLKFGKCRDVNG